MLVVPDRPAHADHALRAGQLVCPDCHGELRPWGWARRRPLLGGDRIRVVRPRRARCRSCAGTHVLLPAVMLERRAYPVTVIGAALRAAVDGHGHRRIGGALGVPADTVRGWLRRLRARADDLAVYCTQLAYRFDAGLGRLEPPAGWSSPLHAAVGLLAAAAAALQRCFAAPLADRWQAASAVTSGLLLANTSRPYPRVQ